MHGHGAAVMRKRPSVCLCACVRACSRLAACTCAHMLPRAAIECARGCHRVCTRATAYASVHHCVRERGCGERVLERIGTCSMRAYARADCCLHNQLRM
eukprot:3261705-Pleurochrysis_carterae.AAC.1